MIAFTNSVVAGACVVLLVASLVRGDGLGLALSLGAAAAVALMAVFLAYQQPRYRQF